MGAEEQQHDMSLQAVEEAISGPGDGRTQPVRSHEDAVLAASSVLPACGHSCTLVCQGSAAAGLHEVPSRLVARQSVY